MHYESDCVCTHDFCKHWLIPRSFLFSNPALGEEASITAPSKMLLLDQGKGEAGNLPSRFTFSTANSFLFYQIVNPCILSLISRRHSPTSKWLHNMVMHSLINPFILPWSPPSSFASLLIICWFWGRGKDGIKKSERMVSFLPFASRPWTVTVLVGFCSVIDVVHYVPFEESARLSVTLFLSMSDLAGGCFP